MNVQWFDASEERKRDAKALHEAERYIGAAYLVGYVLECKLKGILANQNRKFPTSGREGHNLQLLWERAVCPLHQLNEERRSFIEKWDTEMRYYTTQIDKQEAISRYNVAQEMATYLNRYIRR